MLNHAILEVAEQLLSPLLKRDPVVLKQLAALDGKVLRVRCLKPDRSFLIWPSSQGLHLETDQDISVDTEIQGTAEQFSRFLLADKEQQERLLFQGELILSGDTGLVRQLQVSASSLDPDWAGFIERITGTLPVAVIEGVSSQLIAIGRQLTASGPADWAEYLQEELRVLPGEYEQSQFSEQVRKLRQSSERLDARLQRLQQQLDQLNSQSARC